MQFVWVLLDKENMYSYKFVFKRYSLSIFVHNFFNSVMINFLKNVLNLCLMFFAVKLYYSPKINTNTNTAESVN